MEISLQEIIQRADELYSRRAEIGEVRRSVEILRLAPGYESSWRLGRAFFFLGQQARARADARAFYSEGVTASRRAVSTQVERVEGHFWLGVNCALRAEGRVSIAALRSALIARRELEKAISIDGSYHAAGPWRVLARLNHKMPACIGDKSLAEHAYEKAIALAPSNTVTRIYFGEMLIGKGTYARAQMLLESVIATPIDPEWAFETTRDKALAEELLRNIARLNRQKDAQVEQR